MSHHIYLDFAASTPIDMTVRNAMQMILSAPEMVGNAASNHYFGHIANQCIEQARHQVATLINADQREIYWMSGATEANNFVLKGVAAHSLLKKKKIITSSIEHNCILNPLKWLKKMGVEVICVDPEPNGVVPIEQVIQHLDDETILVSLMHVNNETGVIQDIAKLGHQLKQHRALFHVDAAQSAGKIPIDVVKLDVDLMSFSAHKVYGPKGIGALYIRTGCEKQIEPLIHGGGHEGHLRSGTLPTHQCVGMGAAFAQAEQNLKMNQDKIQALSDKLISALYALDDVTINGAREQAVPNIVNVCFKGVEGEALMNELSMLAMSFGSACTADNIEPSHVLSAMGVSIADISRSIRISLGQTTTEEEIDIAINQINQAIAKLRKRRSFWR